MHYVGGLECKMIFQSLHMFVTPHPGNPKHPALLPLDHAYIHLALSYLPQRWLSKLPQKSEIGVRGGYIQLARCQIRTAGQLLISEDAV